MEKLEPIAANSRHKARYPLDRSLRWKHYWSIGKFSQFLPFLTATFLQFAKIRWWMIVNSDFQVMPQIFSQIYVQILTLFQNTNLPFVKIFPHSFCPVHWVIVLLGCKCCIRHSFTSDWNRFSSRISVQPLTVTGFSVPSGKKQIMMSTWCYHHHPQWQDLCYLGESC